MTITTAHLADIETQLRRGTGECADLFAELHNLGLNRCLDCLNGCDCPMNGTESCGHYGCWGPNSTNDCAGVTYAQTLLPGENR